MEKMSVEYSENRRKEILKRYGDALFVWLSDLSSNLKACHNNVEYIRNNLEDLVAEHKVGDNTFIISRHWATIETCRSTIELYSNMIVEILKKLIEAKYDEH